MAEDVDFTNLIKDEKLNHVIFQLENWQDKEEALKRNIGENYERKMGGAYYCEKRVNLSA